MDNRWGSELSGRIHRLGMDCRAATIHKNSNKTSQSVTEKPPIPHKNIQI